MLRALVMLCLVLVPALLRWERRRFQALGKGAAWLPMRLASVPIALLTAALVWLPARAFPGMEALAAFYILLLVVAPVFWVGAHWGVGRWVRPVLSFEESARMAALPVAALIGVALLAQWLQPVLWSLLRAGGGE
jgi:hypothetical protein